MKQFGTRLLGYRALLILALAVLVFESASALAHEPSSVLEEFLSDPIANDGHRIAVTVYPVDYGDERRLHYYMCFDPCTAEEAAELPYDLQSYDFDDYEGFDGTQAIETTLEFDGTCFIDDDAWCEGQKPYQFFDTRGETPTDEVMSELYLHPLENHGQRVTISVYVFDYGRREDDPERRPFYGCWEPCTAEYHKLRPYTLYPAEVDGFEDYDGTILFEGDFTFDATCFMPDRFCHPHYLPKIFHQVEGTMLRISPLDRSPD